MGLDHEAFVRQLTISCSVHSGSIQGLIKSMFGQSERVRYKEDVVPLFSTFLKKCYSKYACRIPPASI